jgi:hypothetical protein
MSWIISRKPSPSAHCCRCQVGRAVTVAHELHPVRAAVNMIMEPADTKALSWSPSDRKPANHDQSAFQGDSRVEPIPLGSSGELTIARAHF